MQLMKNYEPGVESCCYTQCKRTNTNLDAVFFLLLHVSSFCECFQNAVRKNHP